MSLTCKWNGVELASGVQEPLFLGGTILGLDSAGRGRQL